MNSRGDTLRREICTALCAAAMLLCPVLLQGQAPSGQINLDVKDPSGAALQVAGKVVAGPAGSNRSFQTDAQGQSTLSNLPFGRYRLEVSKDGFATQSVVIDVQSGTP